MEVTDPVMIKTKFDGLPQNVQLELEAFEVRNQCKVLYLTEYGSKLYGTNNPNSDTDYKGVFIQDSDLVLLKKDMAHWTSNSNNTQEKNGADDIDMQLFSVHKLFELIRKGETGALDILFSMWSPSIRFEELEYTDIMRKHYKKFLNRDLHSFVGYAVGQASKYGIKGSRYKELTEFNEYFGYYAGTNPEGKLGNLFPDFEAYFGTKMTKYLKMTTAPGPKTLKEPADIEYVEILGKLFSGDVTQKYFFTNIKKLENSFGNRTKSSAAGVDWKALSHSVRVLDEVEELLDTGFIKFPLITAETIKLVKSGQNDIELVMDVISTRLDIVKAKLDASDLPAKSDRTLMDDIELKMFDWQNGQYCKDYLSK